MKTHGLGGYVAMMFACAYACGGAPAPFGSPSTTTDDGGAAEGATGADDGDGSDLQRKGDAGAGDGGPDAPGRSDGGAQVGAGDDGTNAPSDDASQYCCMSGAFYACPANAALSQCTGSNVPSGCTRDRTHDSACTAVDAGASSGKGNGTGSSTSSNTSNVQPPTPVKNACGGLFAAGLTCGAGGSCIDGHCAGGSCYPNDVGNPCTYDNDCGQGNHCTNGCCQSPEKGSPCSAFWNCKSNTCSNGVCQ